MKKLILISALLFSFNGWAETIYYTDEEFYGDKEPINLVCEPTNTEVCSSEDECGYFTLDQVKAGGARVPKAEGVTLRETILDEWELTIVGIKYYGLLENNIISVSDNDFLEGTPFYGHTVTWTLDTISAILKYDYSETGGNYSKLIWSYQCSKTQSLLD